VLYHVWSTKFVFDRLWKILCSSIGPQDWDVYLSEMQRRLRLNDTCSGLDVGWLRLNDVRIPHWWFTLFWDFGRRTIHERYIVREKLCVDYSTWIIESLPVLKFSGLYYVTFEWSFFRWAPFWISWLMEWCDRHAFFYRLVLVVAGWIEGGDWPD
jgi:hypothetical protein